MAKRYPTAPQVVVPVESPSEQKCDTSEIETSISRIGGTLEVPANVLGYATYHTFTVATGKKGSAPGKLNYPHGVAIDELTIRSS